MASESIVTNAGVSAALDDGADVDVDDVASLSVADEQAANSRDPASSTIGVRRKISTFRSSAGDAGSDDPCTWDPTCFEATGNRHFVQGCTE